MNEKGANGIVILFAIIIVVVLAVSLSNGTLDLPNIGMIASDGNNRYVTDGNANNGSAYTSSGNIEIYYPRNPEVMEQGKSYTFRWSGGSRIVNLALYGGPTNSSFPVWSQPSLPNSGYYTFTVPGDFKGIYRLEISDEKNKAYSGGITIQEGQSTSGWYTYVDPSQNFEIQYPTTFQTSVVQEKDTYPYKPHEVFVDGFLRAVQISRTNWSTKNIPTVQVLVFKFSGWNIENWMNDDGGIKKGFSTMTKQKIGNRDWYRFTNPKADADPDYVYATWAGSYVYAVSLDYGYINNNESTIGPNAIVGTFKLK